MEATKHGRETHAAHSVHGKVHLRGRRGGNEAKAVQRGMLVVLFIANVLLSRLFCSTGMILQNCSNRARMSSKSKLHTFSGFRDRCRLLCPSRQMEIMYLFRSDSTRAGAASAGVACNRYLTTTGRSAAAAELSRPITCENYFHLAQPKHTQHAMKAMEVTIETLLGAVEYERG
jgi:hypothetical protein